MLNLDLFFLISFSISILFLLSTVLIVLLIIKNVRAISRIKGKRKYKSKIKKLSKTKKRLIVFLFIFSLLTFGSAGIASYISYYQSINLSQKDSENVVKGYYLINDIESELLKAKDKSIDNKKATQNIQNLSNSMASFGGMRASDKNKEDGQLILNRYYNIIKEIGVNISSQPQDFYGNAELTDEFVNDLKRAKDYQKEVIKYYKVNEDELKKGQ